MNLISIIIPVYNGEKYIEQTIHSVITQSYSNWELIIIDDGSNDSTAELINPFLKDERIKYFFIENGGVSVARNKGIEISVGDFIAFLDADDVWVKENLEVKLKYLLEEKIDFVFANMFICDEKLNVLKTGELGTDKNMVKNILLWEKEVIPCPSGNLLIRKKCFANGLKFDTNLSTAADQDFSIYLALNYLGKYINQPLIYYRTHLNNMSKNIRLMEKDHLLVYQKAIKNQLMDNFIFRINCYSNLFLILGKSFWKDANNKQKGSYYLSCAIIWFPPNAIKLIRKILQ